MSAGTDRLDAIAEELEEIESRAKVLYAERLDVWREEIAAGTTPVVLARHSRVKPVTVRQLLVRAGAR